MCDKKNALEINNICKKFGKKVVLKNISLLIPKGSTYALLGPNGSGKTTLLKSLMGSIFFDKGNLSLNGKININTHAYKRQITYMPQIAGFLPHLSAKESIKLLIELRQARPEFKEELIQDLGIKDFWNKPFGDLSGGMKQKINILQCFMFESDIVFLDEPTSSLDPQVAGYVKKWIKNLKQKGKTLLFTSHIMSEVEEVADKMALLDNGELLFEVSPSDFIKKYKTKNLEAAMLEYWGGNAV